MPNLATPGEIHKTVAAVARGEMPAGGFYTANLFIGQRRLSEELIARVGLAPLVKEGRIVWSSLTETARRWRAEYQGKPFQHPCPVPSK